MDTSNFVSNKEVTLDIDGVSISFDQEGNPIKKSIKKAYLISLLKLSFILVFVTLAFYTMRKFSFYDKQGIESISNIELVNGANLFLMLVLVISTSFWILSKVVNLYYEQKSLSIFQSFVLSIGFIFTVLLVPFLQETYLIVFYLFIVLSISSPILNTMIVMLKLLSKKWNMEKFECFRTKYEIYDDVSEWVADDIQQEKKES